MSGQTVNLQEREIARPPAAASSAGWVRFALMAPVRIAQGLGVTIVNLFRPKVTVQYPFQQLEFAQRYRGMFLIQWDKEKGRTKCTACLLCAQACPTGVISIEPKGKGKDREPAQYAMDLNRCFFCHLCVEACPFDAIHQSTYYRDLAQYRREDHIYTLEQLQERPEGEPQPPQCLVPRDRWPEG